MVNRGNLREPHRVFLLFEVSQRLAQVFVIEALVVFVEGVRLFAKRPIIDEAATAKCSGQLLFLFVSRIYAVFVSSLLVHGLHGSRYRVNCQRSCSSLAPNKERASIPGINDRGFTPHYYNQKTRFFLSSLNTLLIFP